MWLWKYLSHEIFCRLVSSGFWAKSSFIHSRYIVGVGWFLIIKITFHQKKKRYWGSIILGKKLILKDFRYYPLFPRLSRRNVSSIYWMWYLHFPSDCTKHISDNIFSTLHSVYQIKLWPGKMPEICSAGRWTSGRVTSPVSSSFSPSDWTEVRLIPRCPLHCISHQANLSEQYE